MFHPYGEARSASSMAWRKPNEVLLITTKGKKEGSGVRMAQFFVGIAHDKGAVLREQYACKNVTGEFFAEFIISKSPVACAADGVKLLAGEIITGYYFPLQVT